ncbi:hypothetical protein [Halioxenophilus sp. WMMB6]|uniref:hypothetical protein n=1 Tax=Halioxenophilus sp. WMMB6 TaxID=3073815 RepID=UPI00295E8372|nr:hypothetical protein [Halioxenophilus sp. WMMB6]
MRKLACCFAVIFLVACSPQSDEPAVLTHSDDGTIYKNDYFQLQIKKPSSWFAQDPADTMKLNRQGAQMIAGDDKAMKNLIAESLNSSLPVLGFFKYPPGAPGKLNPNIISVAENVGLYPGIKTGCDYLEHVRAVFNRADMAVELSDSCMARTIGKAQLGYLELRMNLNGVAVLQQLYACIKNQHALSFTLTYFDEVSQQEVDAIFETLYLTCG